MDWSETAAHSGCLYSQEKVLPCPLRWVSCLSVPSRSLHHVADQSISPTVCLTGPRSDLLPSPSDSDSRATTRSRTSDDERSRDRPKRVAQRGRESRISIGFSRRRSCIERGERRECREIPNIRRGVGDPGSDFCMDCSSVYLCRPHPVRIRRIFILSAL